MNLLATLLLCPLSLTCRSAPLANRNGYGVRGRAVSAYNPFPNCAMTPHDDEHDDLMDAAILLAIVAAAALLCAIGLWGLGK